MPPRWIPLKPAKTTSLFEVVMLHLVWRRVEYISILCKVGNESKVASSFYVTIVAVAE